MRRPLVIRARQVIERFRADVKAEIQIARPHFISDPARIPRFHFPSTGG